MKIHTDIDQRSLAWETLRAGKITASNAHRLVTPLGKIKTGDGPKTLALELLAERWLGGPLPQTWSSFATENGNILEEFARPAFTLETGLETKQVGFIESDDGVCGCSPDGIIAGCETGLEIKCPQIVAHCRYLLDNCVPEDYILQTQFSMYVTGWKQWYFTSFRRGMPPLILLVNRDEKFQDAIHDAVELWSQYMDEAWNRLVALNGGEPKRQPFVPSSPDAPKFTWQTDAVTP